MEDNTRYQDPLDKYNKYIRFEATVKRFHHKSELLKQRRAR
jgi:hypothetical protein